MMKINTVLVTRPARGHEAALQSDLFLGGLMLPRLAACSWVPELLVLGCFPRTKVEGRGTASAAPPNHPPTPRPPNCSRKDDRNVCVILALCRSASVVGGR